jgi:hypothetical protein
MAAPQLFDLVKMTTPTTGAGTLILGSAVGTFRSFATAGVPNGATVRYVIADPGLVPTQREWGTGVYTSSGTTLTRVLGGSSTGALLNLSGAAHIAIAPMAEDLLPYVASRADIATSIIHQATFSTPDGAPWVHGTSAGPMAIQDATAQWWEIDLSLGSMVTWFGAVADNGATDNRAAFLLADARGPFTIPVGVFGINTTTAITNEVTALDGGQINVATGQTLTLSGGLRAGIVKVFTGTGIVSGLPVSQAEWFANDLKNTTTNALAPLQAWLDSVVNSGVCNMGVGYFYTTGATALTATKGQKVIGAGQVASSIRFSSTTTNGIAFSGSVQGAALSGIFFDIQNSANIPVAGRAVSLSGSVIDLNDVGIGHAYDGIYCNASGVFATGLRINGCFNTGLWCDDATDVYFEKFLILAQQNWIGVSSVSGSFSNGETVNYSPSGATGVLLAKPSTGMFIVTKRGLIIPQAGDTITGATSGATATVSTVTRPHANGGIRLYGNSESALFFDADVIGGQYGLITDAGSSGIGHSPAYCKFTRVQFDSADNAVYLEKLWSTRFTNCWFSNRPREGCIVTSSCVDVSFDDCDFINNGRDGLYIQSGAAQITVNGGSAIGNSVADPSNYHGIRAEAGASDFTITNVQGGNAEYGPQAYDVFIAAGASDRYVISNISNGTGLVADNGTGRNKTVEKHGGISVDNQHYQTVVATSPYTALSTDYDILVYMTVSGVCTINLPAASSRLGKNIFIKDAKGIALDYNLTVHANGTDKFEGGLSNYTYYSNYEGHLFAPVLLGAQWTWIVKS